ncbi:MAG: CDP-alcohol phosphatidyltransferase family protein [Defluviitaleaceae bacterium]|nr:CDP-alcohol phosphatidyltransferase family protein [Defluviitaleaceae bacterium]
MTLTVSRIIGALSLLFVAPLSAVFFVIYSWCITSDLLDGFLARRAKVTSNFGALLDSVADLLVALVMLTIFFFLHPLEWAFWMVILVTIVLSTRVVALVIGFIKFKTFTMLHTYSNKGAALMLASFPVLFMLAGLTITIAILFVAAILSACEELIITIRAKEFKPNITSMLAL